MTAIRSASRLSLIASHTRPVRRHLTRASSTMAAAKNEWLVLVPDFPNMLEKRMEVRAQHFEGLKSAPHIKFGGGLLAGHPKPGDGLQLYGSAVTIEADTREEVVRILKDDIYAKSGVWNVDIAQILPFKTGARAAL